MVTPAKVSEMAEFEETEDLGEISIQSMDPQTQFNSLDLQD